MNKRQKIMNAERVLIEQTCWNTAILKIKNEVEELILRWNLGKHVTRIRGGSN